MKRTGLLFTTVLGLSALGAAGVQAPSVPPDRGAQSDADRDARAELIAAWREALDLDLAPEILQSATSFPGGSEALSADGEALALYARALAVTGQQDSARRALDAASPKATGRVQIELALAGLDLDQDQLAAVETRLSDENGVLRPRFDDAARARFLLGRARVRGGSSTTARAPLETFVTRWPRHADGPAAWHMLAQEAVERRDLDRARECRERGAELGRWHAYYRTRLMQRRANPDAPEPRIGLAQLWIAAEDWERARAELDVVLATHPEACAAWTTLGELERKLGRLDPSRAAYSRAIECDPNAMLARYALGLLLAQAGDHAAARAQLERICESPAGAERRYLGAHLALARTLIALDESEAGEARYAKFRELGGTEPLNPPD